MEQDDAKKVEIPKVIRDKKVGRCATQHEIVFLESGGTVNIGVYADKHGVSRNIVKGWLTAEDAPLISGDGVFPWTKDLAVKWDDDSDLHYRNTAEYIDFTDTGEMAESELRERAQLIVDWLKHGFPKKEQREFLIRTLCTKVKKPKERSPKIICLINRKSDLGKSKYTLFFANIFGTKLGKNYKYVTAHELFWSYDTFSGIPVVIIEDLVTDKKNEEVVGKLLDFTNLPEVHRNPKFGRDYKLRNLTLAIINSNHVDSITPRYARGRFTFYDMAEKTEGFEKWNKETGFLNKLENPEERNKLLIAFRWYLNNCGLELIHKDTPNPQSAMAEENAEKTHTKVMQQIKANAAGINIRLAALGADRWLSPKEVKDAINEYLGGFPFKEPLDKEVFAELTQYAGLELIRKENVGNNVYKYNGKEFQHN